MTINPYDEMMTEAEQVCWDEGWLTPLEAVTLRARVAAMQEEIDLLRSPQPPVDLVERATLAIANYVRDTPACERVNYAGHARAALSALSASKTNDAGPKPLTDDAIHTMALTLRGWLPGEILLGTVERALREALRAFGGELGRGIGETPKETPIPHEQGAEIGAVSFEGESLVCRLMVMADDMLSEGCPERAWLLAEAITSLTLFAPRTIGPEAAQVDQRWDYAALCAAARALDRVPRPAEGWSNLVQAAACVDAYVMAVAREEREEYEREQAESNK